MSLVERAAKRLEELGKAGSQVSGDLAHPLSQGEAAASLIERAVRKARSSRTRGGPGSQDVPPASRRSGRHEVSDERQSPIEPRPRAVSPRLATR